jgi:acetate kinase
MLRCQDLRIVIAHLGNGASLSAVRNGVCMETSMGFTPLEGIMMGTRSGSVDPGMLIYLLRNGLNVDDLDRGLNYQSGLLGVSGISPDMREVLPAARIATRNRHVRSSHQTNDRRHGGDARRHRLSGIHCGRRRAFG